MHGGRWRSNNGVCLWKSISLLELHKKKRRFRTAVPSCASTDAKDIARGFLDLKNLKGV